LHPCRHEDLEDMQRTVLAFGAIYDQESFELTDEEVQQEFKARSAFLCVEQSTPL